MHSQTWLSFLALNRFTRISLIVQILRCRCSRCNFDSCIQSDLVFVDGNCAIWALAILGLFQLIEYSGRQANYRMRRSFPSLQFHLRRVSLKARRDVSQAQHLWLTVPKFVSSCCFLRIFSLQELRYHLFICKVDHSSWTVFNWTYGAL